MFPKSNNKILFEKDYDVNTHHIWMEYVRGESGAFYVTEAFKKDKYDECESVIGIFCLKSRKLFELSEKEFRQRTNRAMIETGTSELICPCCGKRLGYDGWKSLLRVDCVSNMMLDGLWRSVPMKMTIRSDGERLLVSTICRNWFLNAKVGKPYHRDFQITTVINGKNGQTYAMPAQWRGKIVFGDNHPSNQSIVNQNILIDLTKKFLSEHSDARLALNKAAKDTLGFKSDAFTFEGLASQNYLRDLYDPFVSLSEETSLERFYRCDCYKKLRQRQRKDERTFPRYLYWGCKEVATKSIRKMLYARPERKWTLRFLHKTLDLSNIDLIRTLLGSEQVVECSLLVINEDVAGNRERQIKYLSDALIEAGFSEKARVQYLFPDTLNGNTYDDVDSLGWLLRDTARMFSRIGSADHLRENPTLRGLHDALSEDLRIAQNALAAKRREELRKRYMEPVEYSERINSLEGETDDANFTLLRVPLDLDSLTQRMHNCVHTYKESMHDGDSIIFEMTMNGKPTACIELDGKGKRCRQALAPCNQNLEGDALAAFNKWAERNNISSPYAS